eukprot:4669750-Alexandrium_andersonii.AAC.1
MHASVSCLQMWYLGHILRRGPLDPLRTVALDRFLGPRRLGGPRRVGAPRILWSEAVVSLALVRLADEPGYRDEYNRDHREYAALH